MKIDAYAGETHFADHLAAIWAAIPERSRGRFVVPAALADHARNLGINPDAEFTRAQGATVVAAYGDLKRMRSLDRRHVALTEHGMGQSYSNDAPSYAGGRDRGDAELFLVPNQHAAGRNRAAYPEIPVAVVGCPKLDNLPGRAPTEDPRPTIAISFHWNCGVSVETRPAWRAFRMALPYLRRRYNVLGHAHPRMLGRIRGHYERLGIEVVPSFTDVCRRADLYICDNSSTLYEFASTGRPVVVMNAPFYRRRVRHGLRFWDAATVGINVERYQQLLPAIDRALTDGAAQRSDREAALDVVYAHRTGAARRAADALVGWAA